MRDLDEYLDKQDKRDQAQQIAETLLEEHKDLYPLEMSNFLEAIDATGVVVEVVESLQKNDFTGAGRALRDAAYEYWGVMALKKANSIVKQKGNEDVGLYD